MVLLYLTDCNGVLISNRK